MLQLPASDITVLYWASIASISNNNVLLRRIVFLAVLFEELLVET